MNFRHSAALALVGWYLMVPPSTPAGLTNPDATLINGSAPIAQWFIRSSYDSAQDCETAKMSGMLAALQIIKDTEKFKVMREKDPYLALDTIEKATAQCVSTDDPRLKAK